MTCSKTARQKIKRNNRHMDTTLTLYRKAEGYLNRIVLAEWPNVGPIKGSKFKINYVEHLIHSTEKNKAVYEDFDRNFYKFPSYLRRQVISKSIGNVSSHLTRLQQWQENGRKRSASCFSTGLQRFPCVIQREYV